MISELAQNLIDKIKSVPALENRVGMAAAGGPTDPSMATVPLPAAWLIYQGDSIDGEPFSSAPQDMTYSFSLTLHISYNSQPDIINTQLPTIEAVARSVSGKESTPSGSRWHYQGATLVDVFSDRMVYELSFMVAATYV